MENLSIENVISKFNVPIEMYNIGDSFFSNYINLKDSDHSFIYFDGFSAFYQNDKISFNVYSMENIYKILLISDIYKNHIRKQKLEKIEK